MKKIISSFLAAVCAAALTVIPVSAELKDSGAAGATFCFDNDGGIPQWEIEAPLAIDEKPIVKLNITGSVTESGDGALCVSENVIDDVEDGGYGSVYISSEDFGLEDFSGCTVQMSFRFDGAVSEKIDALTLFSDGTLWLTSAVSAENDGRWSKISITVPENVSNGRIGFTVPLISRYSGEVVYIDNVMVYDAKGNLADNVGDYHVSSSNIDVSIGTAGRIILIAVLAIIIALIIIGIKYIVAAFMKKFI